MRICSIRNCLRYSVWLSIAFAWLFQFKSINHSQNGFGCLRTFTNYVIFLFRSILFLCATQKPPELTGQLINVCGSCNQTGSFHDESNQLTMTYTMKISEHLRNWRRQEWREAMWKGFIHLRFFLSLGAVTSNLLDCSKVSRFPYVVRGACWVEKNTLLRI